MTRRISAVAVCRSSASCVSLNSRAFWIAITAWSAKVFEQRDLLVARTASAGWRSTAIEPMPRPSHSIGAHSDRAVADQLDARCAPTGGASASAAVSGMWIARRSPMTRAVIVCQAAWETCAAMASSADPRHAPACTWPSSSTRKMPSCSVANRCWPLSRILSNTGAVSATELLMTCSTSAVAVCCSSASLVSLNRRAFWIAITAWSANVAGARSPCPRMPLSGRADP